MDKHKAIPQGYMTVGEIARKMDVTVRALQHYDREGLLSPSAMSEGGRRLYTDKDIVKLHQILSLKHLGFSLDDIKNRLIPLDTPAEIADVLMKQATAVKQKIESLSESLRELEILREEVLQMELLPKAFETIGKLFPASWGYKLMTESVFKFESLLPFLLIFVLAVVACNILLRRIDK